MKLSNSVPSCANGRECKVNALVKLSMFSFVDDSLTTNHVNVMSNSLSANQYSCHLIYYSLFRTDFLKKGEMYANRCGRDISILFRINPAIE